MIIFESIQWRNFLSTGNAPITVKLNVSPHTLIVGENGSGKSTVLDALCFGLFGKSYRGVNKPQLVNSVNQKRLLVDISFKIGTKKYRIVRGIKPAKFEIYINGKMTDQTAANKDYQDYFEKKILKLNYKSFTQIVILGSSSFVPFMQLPAAHRREIIEDLLDIRIFSAMNILLKDKLAENYQCITQLKYNQTLIEAKMKIHNEHIVTLTQDKQKKIDEYKKQVDFSIELRDDLKIQLNTLKNEIKNKAGKTKNYSKITSMIEQYNIIESKLKTKIKTQNNAISFYKENETCPTCTQKIDAKFRNRQITRSNKVISTTKAALDKLDVQHSKLYDRRAQIEKLNKEINKLSDKQIQLSGQLQGMKNQISLLTQEAKKLVKQKDTVQKETKNITALEGRQNRLNIKHEQLTNEKETYDVVVEILKDRGIKTKIINQYIPVMNKLINSYLAAMDFFVNFELNDKFEEIIRSRFRDEFTYDSFSEGEKMRIDLALLFTWRAIAKMKNSTSTNLLILDEVFDASLDTSGCDEFLKLIRDLGKGTNVFVISQKSDALVDKFYDVIKFEKQKNFTRIVD